MHPDDFKQAWQTQSPGGRLRIDVELLLKEVQRNERYFTAMIFGRDVREVGIALLLVPVWFYTGYRMSLPWTWYLTVPALVWVAGFMLVDRMRQHRQAPELGDPLCQRVESSLAQIEHQIWLLGNVFWWYLLPFALSMLAFFGQITWEMRWAGWFAALAFACVVAIAFSILAGVYRLNQVAVRTELLPRRQELEALLRSLKEETPSAG